jgi:hypothetical protein
VKVRNFCIAEICLIAHSRCLLRDLFRRVFSHSFGHLLKKSLEVSALDFCSQYWSCVGAGKLLLARKVVNGMTRGGEGEGGRTSYTASPS